MRVAAACVGAAVRAADLAAKVVCARFTVTAAGFAADRIDNRGVKRTRVTFASRVSATAAVVTFGFVMLPMPRDAIEVRCAVFNKARDALLAAACLATRDAS